jgi:hypothetical protein
VVDRVGDGGGDTDEADLAQALGAEGIDDLVVLVDEEITSMSCTGLTSDCRGGTEELR